MREIIAAFLVFALLPGCDHQGREEQLLNARIEKLEKQLAAEREAYLDREIDMPLPDASDALPLSVPPQELIVNLDEEGQSFVDERAVSVNELADIMSQAVKENPDNVSVVIRAHKNTRLQAVVFVMDLCRRYNVSEYNMSLLQDDEIIDAN